MREGRRNRIEPRTDHEMTMDSRRAGPNTAASGSRGVSEKIIENYKLTKALPFSLLSPLTFSSYVTPQVESSQGKGLRKMRKRAEAQSYRQVLEEVQQGTGKEFMSPTNVTRYTNRLRLHYERYGHYTQDFSRAMSSPNGNTYGMIVMKRNPASTPTRERNYKFIGERTSVATVEKWLAEGKVALIDPTSKALATTFSGYEMYEEAILERVDDYLPMLGFGSVLWYTTGADLSRDLMSMTGKARSLEKLSWLLTWQVNLPALQLTADDDQPPTVKYPGAVKLTMHLSRTGSVDFVTNVITVLVSEQLQRKLARSKRHTFMLNPDRLEFGDLRKEFQSDEQYTEFKKSLSYSICDDLGVSLPNWDRLSIRGTYTMMGRAAYSAYINMCMSALLDADVKAIYKIVLLANKGQGKSTLINRIRDVNIPSRKVFIEDSDDWGKFISFILSESGSQSIEAADAALTDADVISYVTSFYSLDDQLREAIPSYFNVIATEVAARLIDSYTALATQQFSSHVRAQLAIDYVVSRALPLLKDVFVSATKLKHLNEKVFEDGMYNYMSLNGYNLYVSFLHIYLDNVKRRNHDLLFRFTNGFDSYMSQAIRATAKHLLTKEYLADYTLKLLYENAEDRSIPLIPVSEVLRLFGCVPCMDDSFNLVVTPLS